MYLGVPHAHEDDACRAGYAGLEIVRAMAAVRARAASQLGAEIGVRVSIHTGPVVVGDMGAEGHVEHLAVGETPNIAARLQSAACSNTVVLSEASFRLLSRGFRCRDLGPMTLTGVTRPIHAYELIETDDRVEAVGSPSINAPPLLGRSLELSALLNVWRQACEGKTGVLLVGGEAGVGKSRLVEALKERVGGEGALVLEGHCSPYFQNSAFYAVTQLLAQWLGFMRDDGPYVRRRKLHSALATIGLTDTAATSLVASLLSLPLDVDDPVRKLGATLQRQRTIEVLVQVPCAIAVARPVLLLLEDLHWADPSTLEFLSRATDQGGPARLVIALTCRPEFRAGWQEKSSVRRLDLGGLTAADAETLMTVVAEAKTLPPEVVRQVVARSDGVPLFIEETTRAIIESGALKDRGDRYELVGPLPSGLVPMTLQDALMARLDRLGPAKVAVQLGATIGREFAYELVHAVSEMDEAVLRDQLDRAVASGLLQRHGTGHETTFVFKHSLVQETAYQSLLRRTRQQHHQRIATALEQVFPETHEQRPELLAHHHTEAGNAARAVPVLGKGRHPSRGARSVRGGDRPLVARTQPARDASGGRISRPPGAGAAITARPRTPGPQRLRCRGGGPGIQPRERTVPPPGRCQPAHLSTARAAHVLRCPRGLLHGHSDRRAVARARRRGRQSGLRMEAHLPLGLYTLYLGDFASSRHHLESGIALAGSTDSATRVLSAPGTFRCDVPFLSGAHALVHGARQ